MRPLRQDVTGTVDASGNASIPVKLPQTGEWHELKVALSTTGPAEWAILVSGTAITFGRGRRVTLGPELIQDGETVTISVTGGPRGAAIIGAITGKSGTPEEILSAYAPQPNTIALDAAIPRQKLFPDGTAIPTLATTPSYQVGNGATVTNRFTLPTGTVAVRVLVSAAGLLFTYSLLVTGHTTSEQYYGDPGAPGSVFPVPTPTLPFTIPIENDWDQQLDFTLTNTSVNPLNVFVSALFAPEAPGQAGASQSTFSPTPAPWQAGNVRFAMAATNIAAGGNVVLIAAPGGAIALRIAFWQFFQDGANAVGRFQLQDTTGALINDMQCNNVRGLLAQGHHEGIAVPTPGAGLRLVNNGAAGSFVSGYVDYSLTST